MLDDLTRVAGAADRKPIIVPYTWNDRCILSGIYASGKNIWRITPDMSNGMTKEKFKVEGTKDPTFAIDDQIVTFPGGKIIEDAKITEVGTCGYWVETAQDVMPVVSYVDNRYAEYPAFGENYESFEAGSTIDFSAANPSGCWEIKKDKTATAKVVENAGNKALALTGSYTVKLKEILKNITAGDTYAENQAWELEVTVPANMDANAEIILFDVYGNKSKAEDGGLKISGGKVYYDKNGEYVEISGVDVSKGGKFRIVRSVDFNNPEAFTSDYSVYDASGKLLGQAKNVPMPTLQLPVQKIGYGVVNVTGEAVLFDNFKIYADGLAADFELYDAYTGIEIETDKLSEARDKSTAYRLSWMNATAYEKVYSIVAEYSDGTKTVIEEIKMAPGTDGVATGIVEVASGKTVKIYARNDSKADPENPNQGNSGNSTSNKNNNTLMLIVTIIGVIAFVALTVVAVMVVLKPAAVEEKKEEPEEKIEDSTEE